MSDSGLTHLNEQGQVHVVDVSAKPVSQRKARAETLVEMSAEAYTALVQGTAPKGDVLATVRVGAIMAVKKTSELIPLCHPLPIESVKCEVDLAVANLARIVVEVSTSAKTGVEMEALTGASVGGLILYDMLKAIDKAMVLGPTRLLSKEGGRSGTYRREGEQS